MPVKPTTEKNIMRSIILSCSRGAARLFRQNVGRAWAGDEVKRWRDGGDDFLTLKNPRPLHAGLCKGSSDIIGWRSVEVTPEMVGERIAVFVALECKTERGRATNEQQNFIDAVNRAGGIAGVVRSQECAAGLLDTRKGR